jgi:DNA polymerase III delta prime subunit
MLPASIDDVVLTKPAEERHLKRLVTGKLGFPSHAKSGLLLYGKYGTGKTTMAHLLAALLEHLHADASDKTSYNWCYDYRSTRVSVTPAQTAMPDVTPASFTLVNCGKHHSNSSTSVVQRIEDISRNSLKYGCVAGSFNHFVLDELDCWSPAAQANLKGLITDSPAWNVFYVTTNKRYDIDEGIISRCIDVELNGGEPQQHLRVLRQHFEHLARFTDEQLAETVNAGDGDWRELEDAVCRL